MSLPLVINVITATATCGAAGAALWGLQYARGLIQVAVRDRQVDRVLALHSELTTGEIGAARARFSELMYRVGEEAFGPGKCWRPDWESLIPPSPAASEAFRTRRFLGAYPTGMIGGEGHRPIYDLRQTLACYDRINEARKREASLDEDLLVSLLGHGVAWWNLLCGRLEPRASAQVYSLVQLASWMEERGWRSDPRNEYRKVPENNFSSNEDDIPVLKIAISSQALIPRYRGSRRRGLWREGRSKELMVTRGLSTLDRRSRPQAGSSPLPR